MSLSINHSFVSGRPDGIDLGAIQPSNWNDVHIITGFPDDASLYLDGTGNFSTPSSGGGTNILPLDNNFTGTNLFSNQLQVGNAPECENAQLTVNFVMTEDTNSSMIDVIASTSGTVDIVSAMVLITESGGDVTGTITGLYIRNDVNSGTTNTTIGIHIDQPEISGSIGTTFGVVIEDLTPESTDSANIYSKGIQSNNTFEGYITNAPFLLDEQSGTISGTEQNITGIGTSFTTSLDVGDIITDNNGHSAQILSISSDTAMAVQGTNFNGISGVNFYRNAPVVRFKEQVSGEVLIITHINSGFILSTTSGINNFVIGNGNNTITGETLASIILGGQFNTISGSESAILGGYGHTISGAESVAIGGYGLNITGSQVVGMGLGSSTHTIAQNNCFIVMDGKVGIGNVAPAYTVDVTGDINFTGNLTQNGSPFSSGTNILPLNNEFTGVNVFSKSFSSGVNTVSFSTTPVFDCSLGNTQTITLTGNVSSSTTTNVATGSHITMVIKQDETGGRTFTWPTNFFGNITISATPNSTNIQEFTSFDGVNFYATSIGLSI